MNAARLVVIVGPTASGKSALGIWLAEQLAGAVVVCDSTQVYRHFDIGTAKAAGEEQRGIRHHLMDLVEPDEIFTAGEYRRRALVVLEDLRRRGKLPILIAGTGLYLRALLEGLADAPVRSEELRERLHQRAARRGSAHLHRVLTRLDPAAAARTAPRDAQKLIRAIEICLLAGKPASEIHRAGRSGLEGFEVRKLGLLPPRAQLYARIDQRVEEMLQKGWLEEVREIVARGVPASAKPFQFIGYAQLRKHLEGALALEQATREIQRATRQYAKRQITWFRKEPGVQWLQGFGDSPDVHSEAVAYLEAEESAERERRLPGPRS
jgi:tRNA dimethylallyltransferase